MYILSGVTEVVDWTDFFNFGAAFSNHLHPLYGTTQAPS
jgi:hypothetical protein